MARRTKNRDAPSKEPSPERQVAFRLGPSWRSAGAAWVGEVDIVARRRQVLVFVEVKARARLDDAAENVTERQQRRIAAAASA